MGEGDTHEMETLNKKYGSLDDCSNAAAAAPEKTDISTVEDETTKLSSTNPFAKPQVSIRLELLSACGSNVPINVAGFQWRCDVGRKDIRKGREWRQEVHAGSRCQHITSSKTCPFFVPL